VINPSFVSAAASPAFGVYPLSVNFISSGSTGLNNFFWDLGTGSATANTELTSYTYTSPGTYTIVLTAWNDFLGCAVYDTITVVVTEQASIILPNVFTPNTDGVNDNFSATLIGVKSLKLEVFSRWGSKVFEGEQTSISATLQDLPLWDGKAPGGGVCAEGVYYYVLTAIGYDTKDYSYTGFVHLFNSR
jgi:gliding motility-associated-like protein